MAPQFGYASWREYYAAASMHDRTQHVKVPLLALNAEDDPFAPAHCECGINCICIIISLTHMVLHLVRFINLYNLYSRRAQVLFW